MKVQPKTIWLRRAEGTIEEVERDGEHTVATFAEADEVLKRWARTAPSGGGYDKCDFIVTYPEDSYVGRFDLERAHMLGTNLLGEHIRNALTFYAGVRCPPHMSRKSYEAFIREQPGKQVEAAKFLTTYQIGS